MYSVEWLVLPPVASSSKNIVRFQLLPLETCIWGVACFSRLILLRPSSLETINIIICTLLQKNKRMVLQAVHFDEVFHLARLLVQARTSMKYHICLLAGCVPSFPVCPSNYKFPIRRARVVADCWALAGLGSSS